MDSPVPTPIRILVVGRLDAVGELYAALDADERFVANLCTSVNTLPSYARRGDIDCVVLHHAAIEQGMQGLTALTAAPNLPTLVLGTPESSQSALSTLFGDCLRYLGEMKEPAAIIAAVLACWS